MNELQNGNEITIKVLHTRKAIKAAIRRLKIRDLLLEVVRDIHGWAESDPTGSHVTTAIDMSESQSLCVGSVTSGGVFSDFGILVNKSVCGPEDYNRLLQLSERYGQEVGQQMTGDCVCDECKAKIERSIVPVQQLDLVGNKGNGGEL